MLERAFLLEAWLAARTRKRTRRRREEQDKLSERTWGVAWLFLEYVGWKMRAGQVGSGAEEVKEKARVSCCLASYTKQDRRFDSLCGVL